MFSVVSARQSFCPSTEPWPNPAAPEHVQTYSTWISLYRAPALAPPTPLPDMFKLVHCEAQTVGK